MLTASPSRPAGCRADDPPIDFVDQATPFSGGKKGQREKQPAPGVMHAHQQLLSNRLTGCQRDDRLAVEYKAVGGQRVTDARRSTSRGRPEDRWRVGSVEHLGPGAPSDLAWYIAVSA